MFVTGAGDLVRVEGQLARNPSFWTTQVEVAREYARIGGIAMLVRVLHSRIKTRLFGTGQFLMTYRYQSVNGQRIEDELENTRVDDAALSENRSPVLRRLTEPKRCFRATCACFRHHGVWTPHCTRELFRVRRGRAGRRHALTRHRDLVHTPPAAPPARTTSSDNPSTCSGCPERS